MPTPLRISTLLVTAAIALLACASDDAVPVSSGYDALYRFPAQATFAWDERAISLPDDPDVDRASTDGLLKQVIAEAFAAHGYTVAGIEAPYRLSYQYSVNRRTSADESRPNIVLIMADDLGYECIGANGGESYATPVLDRMAAEGVRFEHCYAQPLCTPTRVKLMTGLSNVRNYVEFGTLEKSQTTFAHLLRDAGYATAIVGKWQLGRDASLPAHFGFDEHCLWQLLRRPSRYAHPGLEVNGKMVDYRSGEYGPDIVCDYACEFIERHKDGPFLLYYPMMLTHSPFVPTPDSPDRYTSAGFPERVRSKCAESRESSTLRPTKRPTSAAESVYCLL